MNPKRFLIRKRRGLGVALLAFLVFGFTVFKLPPVKSVPGLSGELFKAETVRLRTGYLQSNFRSHTVRKGENLYRISRNNSIPLSVLAGVNGINPNLIKEGQRVYIPPVQGSIPIPPQEGKPQSKKLSVKIIRPVGGFISSRYGFRWGRVHRGLDIAAPTGTPVRAASSGKVIWTGWNGGYGLLIKINHGRYNTCYGHLSRIMVKTGADVKQGQVIGLVGTTGHSYGSHLHFELEIYGIKVNPTDYLL
jgi:murein DD-endopeptidase MepM/ murein hydrolase activator NlpD